MPVMDFPSSPINGQTTTDGRYYFDSSVGSTGAWRSTPLPVGGLPAGSIMAWGTNTPPANWLLADGSAVSRSVYSSLFAVIGTQYGAGDGTTTFNLPDLRGRVPVGRNGGTFGTLGATGGAETHTLTEAQMPTHGHGSLFGYSGNRLDLGEGPNRNELAGDPGPAQLLSNPGITTGFRLYSEINTSDRGGSQPHNNLQPYQVVNYIIKFSAGWTAGDSELATRLGVVEQRQILSPNYVINGGFDIWQRGTSAVNGIANGAFHPDRWLVITDGVGTVNSSRIDVASQGIGSQYGWRLERTAGTSRWVGIHMAEGALAQVGKTVTLSVYLRKGSALTTNVVLDISTRSAKFGAVAESRNVTIPNSAISTTSFTRFSVSLPVTAATSSANADLFEIEIVAASQAGASNAFLDIAGVQLEDGTIPTPFRRNAPSIQAELAACQRYYVRWSGSSTIGSNPGIGAWTTDTTTQITLFMPVEMRVRPISLERGGNIYPTRPGISGYTVSAAVLSRGDTKTQMIIVTSSGSGAGIGSVAQLELSNSDASYIALSAEL